MRWLALAGAIAGLVLAIGAPAGAQPGVAPVSSTPKNGGAVTHLTYYGGRVMSGEQMYAIYWGSGVANQAQLTQFLTDLSGDGVSNFLSQYSTSGVTPADNGASSNQTISGLPTFGGSYTDPTGPAANITSADVKAEIAKVQASQSWAPGPLNAFIVFTPAGTTITDSFNNVSLQSWCYEHDTAGTAGTAGEYAFAMIPDLTAAAGGCGAGTVFANTTSGVSHELFEMVTDPEIGLVGSTIGRPIAWYDSSNGEIGDICNQQQTTASVNGHTWTLQKEWSNAANACATITLSGAAVTPPADLPESALMGLLPIPGLGLVGGAVWAVRRRRRRATPPVAV